MADQPTSPWWQRLMGRNPEPPVQTQVARGGTVDVDTLPPAVVPPPVDEPLADVMPSDGVPPPTDAGQAQAPSADVTVKPPLHVLQAPPPNIFVQIELDGGDVFGLTRFRMARAGHESLKSALEVCG
jgi:hypothetical protein